MSFNVLEQVDYQSTVNSSASYDDIFLYSELNIDCELETIPAFAQIFFPVLYTVLFVAGLVGNALVVWVLLAFKKVRAMTDVCLLNLAISDLLFVFSLPFLVRCSLVSQWTFGNAMCRVVGSACFIGFYSGSFFMAIMSIDRCLAVVRSVCALRVRTSAHGVVAGLALWAVAILASAPDLIFFREVDDGSGTVCLPHCPGGGGGWRIFSNFEVNVLGWLIPVGILIFCCRNILRGLQRCHTRNKCRAVKLVFIVVAVFFLFWAPVDVVLFLDSMRSMHIIDDCRASQRLDLALELAGALSFVHCCLNPIIYAFVGEKFEKCLCEAFGGCARFLLACSNYGVFHGHGLDGQSSVHVGSSQSSFVGGVLWSCGTEAPVLRA